jgi:hypothetical protein
MQRRNLLIGMGSLAAGGAATIGTGAFTSVEANRNFGITIADDAQAYLAIEPASGPNGGYAYEMGEDVEIELGGGIGNGQPGGDGVNAQALTQIDKIIKVKNQGTQPVNVKIDKSNLKSATDNLDDQQVRDLLTFYRGDNPNVNDIEKGGYTLDTGESFLLGIEVDLTGYGGANDYSEDLERLIDDGGRGNLVIRAEATSNAT